MLICLSFVGQWLKGGLNVVSTAVKNGHGNCFSFRNRSYPGDPDSGILSYPAPVIRKKRKANKHTFFLLSSTEARESKLKEI